MHLRSSHGAGARPYRCTLCDATFALASSWHKHRLVHMDDKRHQCPVCGKKFRQSSNLNGHMKTHTGDKRHVCAVCEKRFATSSSLDVHMRSHTGIKPYMCQSCDRCFASKFLTFQLTFINQFMCRCHWVEEAQHEAHWGEAVLLLALWEVVQQEGD